MTQRLLLDLVALPGSTQTGQRHYLREDSSYTFLAVLLNIDIGVSHRSSRGFVRCGILAPEMLFFETGDHVRYQGLGAGRIVGKVEREFQGRNCIFAVISFPHKEMKVQLPLGDPLIEGKISKIISKTACRRLLRSLREKGRTSERTWDQRERLGMEVIRNGGPQEWTDLLRSYVRSRNEGLVLASSDMDIVRSCIELLAAELTAAEEMPYELALLEVERAYRGCLKSPWQNLNIDSVVLAEV